MKMMFFVLIAASALIAKDLMGAQSEILVLDKKDNGKEITVHLGEVLQIELEEKGGTGYLWEFSKFDQNFLVIANIKTQKPVQGQAVGRPILKRWQIKTLRKGKTRVLMYNHRPWEEKGEPAGTFSLTINII